MKKAQTIPVGGAETRTGRRPNPTIDGPRENTVCLMLSDGEKLALDRLAFCEQITRSGILAKIVADFVLAAGGSKQGQEAEIRLMAFLGECRKSVKRRGEQAAKWILP